jgi:hypothetical protein
VIDFYLATTTLIMGDNNLLTTVLYILGAIGSVTIIDTVGAVASRKLNFNYGWLTILPLLVYTLAGYFISAYVNFSLVLLSSLIIGIYDATVGWKLALIFKANMVISDKDKGATSVNFRIVAVTIISFGCSSMGFFLQANTV